jgi:mannosyltransferase
VSEPASGVAGVCESPGVPALSPNTVGSAPWWPLPAIVLLAAVLRLTTLGSQSFWYDEAFTPVHVLRPSLEATLHNLVHFENTPPLWYLLEWAVSRVLGTGVVALRLLSAIAGTMTVVVAWAIGAELAGRRAAIVSAALVASSPLLVWYSQEARAYGLFVLMSSVAMLCFLRVLSEPSPRRLAAFALASSLALLTHYFAVFLLIPMILWLLRSAIAGARADRNAQQQRDPRRGIERKGEFALSATGFHKRSSTEELRSTAFWAAAVPVLVGAALIPLILAQGGHGTQWIGEWALASRLETIPQYYLTGYTGSALGHGVELLVLVAILAGVVYGLWCTLSPREERSALIALTVAAAGCLIPIALATLGADYLAPRNLVAAMVAVSVLLAIVIAAERTGRKGMALAWLLVFAFTMLTIDISLSPRLQRGDWKGVARVLEKATTNRAIVTVELGAAPLEYYMPPLKNLARGAGVSVSEVDETGYAPLRASPATPPAPGFKLVERSDVNGLFVYRFTSKAPVTLSERTLREQTITHAPHPEVLVPASSEKSA